MLLVLALYRGGWRAAIVGDGIERAWDHGGRGDGCRSRLRSLHWLVLVMVDAGGVVGERWPVVMVTGHAGGFRWRGGR